MGKAFPLDRNGKLGVSLARCLVGLGEMNVVGELESLKVFLGHGLSGTSSRDLEKSLGRV